MEISKQILMTKYIEKSQIIIIYYYKYRLMICVIKYWQQTCRYRFSPFLKLLVFLSNWNNLSRNRVKYDPSSYVMTDVNKINIFNSIM